MSDKRFTIMLTLFAVTAISLAVALLTMVLLDETVHSDGCYSPRGGGTPVQSLLAP